MRHRSGFTLVEVLIGLTLSALVVMIAHGLFSQAGLLAISTAEEVQRADRLANGRRFLRAAFQASVVGDSGTRFEGDPASVYFTTWALGSRLAAHPRSLTISVHDSVLVAISPSDTLLLANGVLTVTIEYLTEQGATSKWLPEWRSVTTLPVGIRFVVTLDRYSDTLLVATGQRG